MCVFLLSTMHKRIVSAQCVYNEYVCVLHQITYSLYVQFAFNLHLICIYTYILCVQYVCARERRELNPRLLA